jgi:hypothetical protein
MVYVNELTHSQTPAGISRSRCCLIWGRKRAGFSVGLNKGMEDVHICMKVLKTLDDRLVILNSFQRFLSDSCGPDGIQLGGFGQGLLTGVMDGTIAQSFF